MKTRGIFVGIGCIFSLFADHAGGYELGTHSRITLYAYEQSAPGAVIGTCEASGKASGGFVQAELLVYRVL